MTTMFVRRPLLAIVALGLLSVGACASGTGTALKSSGATPISSADPPSPDPRIGLAAGVTDPGVALWNMRLVSNVPSPEGFAGATNSDLAFTGNFVIQGNYNGFMVWDVSNARRPVLRKPYLCPASQSDVSVYNNLLFVSGEGLTGRIDCGSQGVPEPVSHDRLRGIRIFDISDFDNPKYVGNVQTCRGSHTHTVVTDPNDRNNVYIYVSGSAGVRSAEELPGCSNLSPDQDPNSALFRIEVIRVPLAAPQNAAIVTSPRIFTDLGPAPRRTEPGAQANRSPAQNAAAAERARTGPSQCHDITVYPAVGLAGGACGGYGLLLDIRDVANPKRLTAVADTNFSFWHSATFSNDGSMVLFTDEWGGGRAPRCRASDRYEWGANAIFTIENGEMHFKSYYKMPAAQSEFENCVAHNGSPIPIPGREVMVQGWYQGGVSVFDWTDPMKPTEIAYFDRGPLDANELTSAGSWSVYWYNGYMYNSEIARGLDILELMPSPHISQNEIDAAKTVVYRQLNPQEQPKMVWPPSFALARAYADQLERSGGLSADRLRAVRSTLSSAEKLAGQRRHDTLAELATQLDSEAGRSRDAAKVRLLAGSVRDLGNGP